DHRSVQALERDLREWVKAWNENPKPFIWTKTADQILDPSDDYCNELTAEDTSRSDAVRGGARGKRFYDHDLP
ncbi:hypothetical protein PFZ49_16410, partial [Microbacterium lacticum]